VVHPRAAGIDAGNRAHYVAVRPDRDPQPVRRFECFTADLYRLADWLKSCGVNTVALQSTGVYWVPLDDILEERGFEVYVLNARHTKNLPGRKSDVQESQWLLKLHTYGLLNNSFHPASTIRTLRTYWRQRAAHVEGALTQMNLQLANVISDLSGVTRQKIVRAIVASFRVTYLNPEWFMGRRARYSEVEESGKPRGDDAHPEPAQIACLVVATRYSFSTGFAFVGSAFRVGPHRKCLASSSVY
jgi:Transposase